MSDTETSSDRPWRMTTLKWFLLAAWILGSYFLSFLVIVILDDRNMISASWGNFLRTLYAPLIWLASKSDIFESFVDRVRSWMES